MIRRDPKSSDGVRYSSSSESSDPKGLFVFLPYRIMWFLFLLPLGLGLQSCQTDIPTINQLTVDKNLPSETMMDADIMYSDSGKVKMKLMAVQLDRYNDKDYIEMPRGMKILFYDDSMKVNSRVKADYGIRHEKEGKMEAKRNVEVVNVKGEKLNTEHLYWDENKKLIYTDEFVKITTKNEVMYGDGLESNEDFTKYKIKNIKGTMSIKDDAKSNQ